MNVVDFLLPWQHSKAFLYAFIAAMSEFWLEWLFAPSLKQHKYVLYIGLIMVAVFQTY